MLARLILIPLGLLLGSVAGLVFLPLATLFDPITREGFATLGFGRIFMAVAHGRMDVVDSILTMGAALLVFLLAVCVVPLVFTALLGEVARLRTYVWYVGAPALGAALMPFVARASLQTKGSSFAATASNSSEPTFLALFFLTGALGGWIYWLVAGRSAMRANR